MILIGLTGGLAAGKSTVAGMLARLGAEVIDADRIAHQVMVRGSPAFAAVVERFGDGILSGDGSIDRQALAGIVFSDESMRRDLEAITHPAILEEIEAQLAAVGDPERFVVLDAPLLIEALPDRGKHLGIKALVVVAATAQDQVSRAVSGRGLTGEDARARMAAQAPQAQKLAASDYIVDNSADLEHLEAAVHELWRMLQKRFGPAK